MMCGKFPSCVSTGPAFSFSPPLPTSHLYLAMHTHSPTIHDAISWFLLATRFLWQLVQCISRCWVRLPWNFGEPASPFLFLFYPACSAPSSVALLQPQCPQTVSLRRLHHASSPRSCATYGCVVGCPTYAGHLGITPANGAGKALDMDGVLR